MNKLGTILTLCGLALLIGAGMLLVIGHNPDNYWYNYQAEILGNFAYGLFALAFLVAVIDQARTKKKRPAARGGRE